MDGCSLDCLKEWYVCCKNCEESCLFRCYMSNCDNLVAGERRSYRSNSYTPEGTPLETEIDTYNIGDILRREEKE